MNDALFWISLITCLGMLVGMYKMFHLDEVVRDTRRIVNGSMAVQLRLHATTARRLATITGDKKDNEVAELAERLLKEHEDAEDYQN